MADIGSVDTSSYPKALPIAPLDTLNKLGGLQQQQQSIQSNAITIDKQKLDLINQRFGLMNAELSSLSDDPKITKEQAAARLTNFANTYKMPPEVVQHMMGELDAAPSVKAFSDTALRRGMTVQEKLNQQYGAPETATDNSTVYQGVRAPAAKGGGFTPATQMPVQVPPTQPNVNNQPTLPNGQRNPNYLQPGIVGPVGPAGVVPARPGGLPVAPQNTAPAVARPGLPVGPVTNPAIQGPSSNFGGNVVAANVGPTTNPAIVTGAAPGVAQAIGEVGVQSGKDYATDLTRAKNFKADLYPAETALAGIKELGPQGVGPGTEALNNVKSAIITWLPNADKKAIDNVGTFEQTRKYLTQIARGSGSTGTNDQLAAAFEANPSIKLSQAATENVLKSVIALRKMQHAQTLLFGQQGLDPSQYSTWIAQNQNKLDARAFGFDMMDNEAKSKLVKTLSKDPKAYQKFETSLQFAHDADLIEPPARK